MSQNSNALTSLPESYIYDSSEKKLTVRGARQFPRELLKYAEDAEILDMSFGKLSELPDDLAHFRNLRIAFFSYNPFPELPEVLSACERLEMVGFKGCGMSRVGENALPSSLKVLTLTDNNLTLLPDSLGRLSELKKLMVAGNQLHHIPETLAACEQLELLRLAENPLETPPTWLLNLPRLGWYSDAGDGTTPMVPELKATQWGDLNIDTKDRLGKSANNEVFKAYTKDGQAVAVKLFGSNVPEHEIQASLLAGAHEGLIGAISRLVGEPGGKQGLVLPLIENFAMLGKPPDFTSFTRDVFEPHIRFSVPLIMHVLENIAAAGDHLHKNGVMHGDIYAHNILVTKQMAYLSDFGDSSIYQPETSEGRQRQQVDVRGFSSLMQDLLTRAEAPGERALAPLHELMAACVHKDTTRLPLFADIRYELATIAKALR